ncbi:hypothetical protein [Pseudomonas sp.]|uniref:hypothetical protein n=1 Tax=Pseudomonas sp. TaxID=306 RepID=UPI00258AD83C|nr:hypothetical protein [Pseudomonas sp.]
MSTVDTSNESSLLLGVMSQARLFQGVRDIRRPAANDVDFDRNAHNAGLEPSRPVQPHEPE